MVPFAPLDYQEHRASHLLSTFLSDHVGFGHTRKGVAEYLAVGGFVCIGR